MYVVFAASMPKCLDKQHHFFNADSFDIRLVISVSGAQTIHDTKVHIQNTQIQNDIYIGTRNGQIYG